jgi:hypothetical protein
VTEPDDELLMRLIVGDLTGAARERLERRFMEDRSFFERLRALEYDMLLSFARHELDEPWRSAMAERLASSESLRRELESLRSFQSVLAARGSPRDASDAETSTGTLQGRAASSSTRWWTLLPLAAATAVLIIAVAVWRAGEEVPSRHAVASEPQATGVVATFILTPAVKQADAASSSSFRVPSTADLVELLVSAPVPAGVALHASVRAVGGAPLEATGRLEVKAGQPTMIGWTIPARHLPPGDYILTVVGGSGGIPIASRSFSVVP